MRTTSRLKGGGYLTSTASVVLLAIPAMKSASEDKFLLLCLIVGMASSILGMTLRWWSHRLEQKEKDRLELKAEGNIRAEGRGQVEPQRSRASVAR